MNAKKLAATFALTLAAAAAQAISVTDLRDATELANSIGGSGITVSNATLSYSAIAPTGTFTGGTNSLGFESGIVLTTGTIGCVAGPNDQSGCTGGGTFTSLLFDFTSDTGKLFFNYVFASEEYPEYVGSAFNDSFELLLNGVNIALLPGGAGRVEINNVNCNTNQQFFRNNSSDNSNGNGLPGCEDQNLDIQYDGLTTVLKATSLLLPGVNRMEFRVTDEGGDSILDSAVFIQAGSFSSRDTTPGGGGGGGGGGGTDPGGNPVPAPTSLLLGGLALTSLAAARRRRT